mmetsp:Transcript_10633/g.24189  ORF Transcript_10633/g.24189 Transcript_10633/m.24189 type:complete len:115 (+) Transcript_10633:1101-1445(+)
MSSLMVTSIIARSVVARSSLVTVVVPVHSVPVLTEAAGSFVTSVPVVAPANMRAVILIQPVIRVAPTSPSVLIIESTITCLGLLPLMISSGWNLFNIFTAVRPSTASTCCRLDR